MRKSTIQNEIESLPDADRPAARALLRRLEKDHGERTEDALLIVMGRYGKGTRRRKPSRSEVRDPDVSLAKPHGPEGESHGGRGGRDPLRFVEDSTPSGTNAYSSSRSSPASRARAPSKRPRAARAPARGTRGTETQR
jgi:hypothetical protein